MQYYKLFFLATVAVASLASPTPTLTSNSGLCNQCSAGSLQCCDKVLPRDDPNILALLNLVLGLYTGPNGQVGITCAPLSSPALW